jgi:hypothetical protein
VPARPEIRTLLRRRRSQLALLRQPWRLHGPNWTRRRIRPRAVSSFTPSIRGSLRPPAERGGPNFGLALLDDLEDNTTVSAPNVPMNPTGMSLVSITGGHAEPNRYRMAWTTLRPSAPTHISLTMSENCPPPLWAKALRKDETPNQTPGGLTFLASRWSSFSYKLPLHNLSVINDLLEKNVPSRLTPATKSN